MTQLAILRVTPERWLLLEIDGTLTGEHAGVKVCHKIAGPLTRRELDRVLAERTAAKPEDRHENR